MIQLPALLLAASIAAPPVPTHADLQGGDLPRLLWADLDGDGTTDLLTLNGGAPRLWRNGSTGLVECTREFGLGDLSSVSAATFVDFDADGLQDLFVVDGAGRARLLRNESGLAFVDATSVAGIAAEGPILQAEWSDVDGNGWTDLVIWTPNEVQVNHNRAGAFSVQRLAVPTEPVVRDAALPLASSDLATTDDARAEDPAMSTALDRNRRNSIFGKRGTAGSPGRALGVTAVGGSTATGGQPHALGTSFQCAKTLLDGATLNCIGASSLPVLGELYPLSLDLNVDSATNRVGMGTLTPGGKLHAVSGVAEPAIVAESQAPNTSAFEVLDTAGTVTMRVKADEGVGNGSQLDMYTAAGANTFTVDAEFGTNGGAAVSMRNRNGVQTVVLDGDNAELSGGIGLYNAAGTIGVLLEAEEDTGNGAEIDLHTFAGTSTVTIDAEEGSTGAGMQMRTKSGQTTLIHDAEAPGVGSLSQWRMADGTATVTIEAEEAAGNGGQITIENRNGTPTIVLDGDTVEPSAQAAFYNSSGTPTVVIDSEEGSGNGSQITLYKFDGTPSITLDAEQGVGGPGYITTEVLEITGGADLVESFETGAVDCPPGSVLIIDPANPGDLTLSAKAYDKRVAGVVSGAGDVRPGLHLGQKGVTTGDTPVALTGRVYVRCSDENGRIEPGDLLTSSSTPGVAMRATDSGRSFGAVLGKAMGALEGESGLVMTLVNLQ